jgi:hypothetical protein
MGDATGRPSVLTKIWLQVWYNYYVQKGGAKYS